MKKTSVALICFVMGLCSVCFGQKATLLVPMIVAQRSLTGQTGDIPTTTLLTPRKSGLFRISLYGIPTATDGDSRFDVYFTYSDDAGPEPYYLHDYWFGAYQTGCNVSTQPYGPFDCYYSAVLRAVAKVPIQFTVTTYGTLTYDLFMTMEQLQ
jgi:hypothetical protein